MIDTQTIKQSVDCRQLIQRDLGDPVGTRSLSATWWRWKCPFHNEKHGTALIATATWWSCRGQCGLKGDAIDWVMKYHNLDFVAACTFLAGSGLTNVVPDDRTVPLDRIERGAPTAPPPAEWQKAAGVATDQAQSALWSSSGQYALRWLEEERGLSRETIWEAKLGFVPGPPDGYGRLDRLLLPTGITIPWMVEGNVWAINVRRSDRRTKKPKYQQAKWQSEDRQKSLGGGRIRGALYWADHIRPGAPVIFVEGEFDCLLTWDCAGHLATPVSLGSASNTLDARWLVELISVPAIYACTDTDRAGRDAARGLTMLSARIREIAVPVGTDMTDYYHVLREFHSDPRSQMGLWIANVLASQAVSE